MLKLATMPSLVAADQSVRRSVNMASGPSCITSHSIGYMQRLGTLNRKISACLHVAKSHVQNAAAHKDEWPTKQPPIDIPPTPATSRINPAATLCIITRSELETYLGDRNARFHKLVLSCLSARANKTSLLRKQVAISLSTSSTDLPSRS